MAKEGIPILERSITAKETEVPNLQGSFQEFANSSNNLSTIGAGVAQSASNQMAVQLGYESGKNPHGDIGPTLTEFDKNFKESYQVQSQSVLSLQAQKLLDDSQVEMAKHNRLTPGMIDKAHEQVQLGLSKISSLAPMEIRPQLEQSFNSSLMQHTTQLKEKMFTQQREDAKNNLINAINLSTQKATDLTQSGDTKGGNAQYQSVIRVADNALANKYITPEEARVAKETAHQSFLNGLYINGATNALKNNQYESYVKELSNGTHGMTPTQHMGVLQAVNNHVGFIKNLQSQQENIEAVKFEEQIAQNVNGIQSSVIADLKNKVSPLQFERLQLEYIKAKKAFNTERAGSDLMINGFSDKEIYPRGTPEQQNKAFDTLVAKHVQDMSRAGTPIGIDEAQSQIAASAAGPVPGYIKVLNAKANSTNPVDIESATKSIQYLQSRKKDGNLYGLDERALAMVSKYQALRRGMIPQDAANQAYEDVYKQKTEDKKVVEDSWSDHIKTIKSDVGKLNYFTNMAGIKINDLVDPLGFQEQAESILHNNFVLTKGDLDTAKKMTTDTIKNTYGESYVNGRKETTFYPLETAVGIPHDGVGYIQDDVIGFVNEQLKSTKAAFDAGKLAYYYEVEPRRSLENAKLQENRPLFKTGSETLYSQMHEGKEAFEKGSQMTIHKHWKNGIRETYPLIIKADPWLSKSADPKKPYTAGWDIVMGTDKGYIPLPRENPMMGQYVVYKPDIPYIQGRYNKEHALIESAAGKEARRLFNPESGILGKE